MFRSVSALSFALPQPIKMRCRRLPHLAQARPRPASLVPPVAASIFRCARHTCARSGACDTVKRLIQVPEAFRRRASFRRLRRRRLEELPINPAAPRCGNTHQKRSYIYYRSFPHSLQFLHRTTTTRLFPTIHEHPVHGVSTKLSLC